MSKNIIVVKRQNNKLSDVAEWISLDEIIMIKTEVKNSRSVIVYYTERGEFVNSTSSDMTVALIQQEIGFVNTDRGMIGNLAMEPELDEKNLRLVYKKANNFVTIRKGKVLEVIDFLKSLIK